VRDPIASHRLMLKGIKARTIFSCRLVSCCICRCNGLWLEVRAVFISLVYSIQTYIHAPPTALDCDATQRCTVCRAACMCHWRRILSAHWRTARDLLTHSSSFVPFIALRKMDGWSGVEVLVRRRLSGMYHVDGGRACIREY
jgi:hypothetical protein